MTPTTPQHLTVLQTDQPVQVIVQQQDDGRWFRVLRWLVASGTWAGLTNEGRAVLVAMHFLATGEDRRIVATLDQVQALAGVSRTRVYEAIRQLTTHPARLLAAHGAGWALLPGRVFAGRASPGPESSSRPPDDSSSRRDWPVQPAGQKSRPPDETALPPQGTRARVDPENLEFDDEREIAVVDLRKEGFKDTDARRLVFDRGITLDQVRDARKNADHISKTGGFRVGRRQYIAAHLQRKYELWDVVAERAQKAFIHRLHEIVQHRVAPSEQKPAAMWVNRLIRERLIRPEMVEGLRGDEVFNVLCRIGQAQQPSAGAVGQEHP